MTQWNFKNHKGNILISQTEEDQPEVILGEMKDIHTALMEVASFFKPNDIILTPEGNCIASGFVGELNN
jgi:hypothetical protein